MHKISAVIITYNEEKDILQCLESLNWADEIIVVDSGSTDNTVDICRKYNAKIYTHSWPGYVAQKNYALQRASFDWVISLDADERLSNELIMEIKSVLSEDKPQFDGYAMPRRTFYLGKWINHSGWYPNYQLRLFRKSLSVWDGNDPHDYVRTSGSRGYLKAAILHYSYENVNDHLSKIAAYTSIMAQGAYRDGARFSLFKMITESVTKFFSCYFLKRGFLDGFQGFVISILGTYYIFIKHLKLWEIERRKHGE